MSASLLLRADQMMFGTAQYLEHEAVLPVSTATSERLKMALEILERALHNSTARIALPTVSARRSATSWLCSPVASGSNHAQTPCSTLDPPPAVNALLQQQPLRCLVRHRSGAAVETFIIVIVSARCTTPVYRWHTTREQASARSASQWYSFARHLPTTDATVAHEGSLIPSQRLAAYLLP